MDAPALYFGCRERSIENCTACSRGIMSTCSCSRNEEAVTGGKGKADERPTRQHLKAAPYAPPHQSINFQAALCLLKLGRPLDALSLADSTVTASCSLDARRFQLRGLILHDLRRFEEATKVSLFVRRTSVHPQLPVGHPMTAIAFVVASAYHQEIGGFSYRIGEKGGKLKNAPTTVSQPSRSSFRL